MATTTNYGWTTPDDTALVKDGASAIRSLGTAVDTTTKNLNPETTLGDIAYRSSTANVKTRLGIGSTGQILTVVGGVPAWAAPAGGGKVLQVVQATYSTETSNTGNTYADTGLSASITPSSTSSKILVLVNHNGCHKDAANCTLDMKLLRGATDIGGEFGGYATYTDSTAQNTIGSINLNYLDTPSTTSSTTYKTQFKNGGAGGTAVKVQYVSAMSTITLLEIGA